MRLLRIDTRERQKIFHFTCANLDGLRSEIAGRHLIESELTIKRPSILLQRLKNRVRKVAFHPVWKYRNYDRLRSQFSCDVL